VEEKVKKIRVQEAVGTVLCHDITKIIPGEFKGVAFEKGHIIREEDIQELLSLGKEHIYVWEKKFGMLHENEAAERLRELTAGEGLNFSGIKEGKIDFTAAIDGLLKVDVKSLYKLNIIGEMVLATLHNNTIVRKNQKVAGTRVIPLVIKEERIRRAEETIKNKIISVIPIIGRKIAIVTTGREIYTGRVRDAFGPVIRNKVEEFGCTVLGQTIVPDDKKRISEAVLDWINRGAEVVVCTGGMSVDPDDMTPAAIRETGTDLICYGAPVLPGSMLLIAYHAQIPILGLPGCVMYNKRTVFDLVLPRILAGERLTNSDITALGHGGLCMDCEECSFPTCSFGKGV
jgi:molybdenum cofactor synthesis domain-containing protein